MKHLLLTTALVTATATGAFAQSADTNANADAAASGSVMSGDMFRAESTPSELRASDFLGMRIYAAADGAEQDAYEGTQDNWEDVGEINDVILNRDGEVQAVLLDIGGFLGIGERQVAVNMDSIKFVSDSSTGEDDSDFFLVVTADRATLEGAPAYGADAEMSDEDTSEQIEQSAEAAGEDMKAAGEDVERGAEAAGEEIEQTAEAAGEEIEDAAEATENMAENAAEETGDAMEQTAEAADNAADEAGEELEQAADATAAATANAGEEIEETAEAAGNEMEEAGDEMAAEATETEAEAETTTSADASATMGGFTKEGFADADEEYLTTENLTGARVYDTNDKWVGEISELVVDDQGKITNAIVDVGGFLGIGEKPVALQLSDLKVMQQEEGDEVRIYTAMAEDELKSMPEFEKD